MGWSTTAPRLAWTFLTMADPDAWHVTMTYLNQRPAPEAEFEVGGRHYAVYAHDWRAESALACTFFEPAATQELAAERLGLPFSTYRDQLAGAVRRVTERLWRRELHGPGGPA